MYASALKSPLAPFRKGGILNRKRLVSYKVKFSYVHPGFPDGPQLGIYRIAHFERPRGERITFSISNAIVGRYFRYGEMLNVLYCACLKG
jgi:hypothetical protein